MRCLILALATLTAGCAANSLAPAADVAFVGVSIVEPDTDSLQAGVTVLVADGRIVAVGTDLRVPARATRIDGAGRYLVPGLAEMHAHVPKQPDGAQYLEDVLLLYVANGITTMRGMNGEMAHLALRERIARDELIAPRLITAGPPFLGKGSGTPEEAAARVAAQADAGFDFIKVHMGLPADFYDAIAAAAAEAGIPIAGHVAEDVGLSRALAVSQASIDHLDAYWPALAADEAEVGDAKYGLMGAPLTPFVDAQKMRALAEATASAGVWNAPTLSAIENFVRPAQSTEPLRYLPPKLARRWQGSAAGYRRNLPFDDAMVERFLELRLQLVKALHDAGAGILLGSDAPQVLNVPGFSIHRELELLVQAGLSPAEALAAGTTEAARYFGREDEFGRIAPGLAADLVLVDDNPLEDIGALREPAGVMLRGRWLPADELQARLDAIAERHAEADD